MILFSLRSLTFSGCHEQGYAGNTTLHSIRVWSVDVWTRCSASHIQIGPRLACLNLLAMQPSTPISAYHHIKIIHKYIYTHDTLWKYIHIRTHTPQSIFSILKSLEANISFNLKFLYSVFHLLFHFFFFRKCNVM